MQSVTNGGGGSGGGDGGSDTANNSPQNMTLKTSPIHVKQTPTVSSDCIMKQSQSLTSLKPLNGSQDSNEMQQTKYRIDRPYNSLKVSLSELIFVILPIYILFIVW